MDRVRHAAILPPAMTARSGPKQCSQNIQKNRCRTTVAEPIGETLAELPFTGDQAVCLGHEQAGPYRFGRATNLRKAKPDAEDAAAAVHAVDQCV